MKQCLHCGRFFTAIRCTQKYCMDRNCRKSRKRQWQKRKLQTDPDYKANQRDAQKRWCAKKRGYWKSYRADHPDYTARNLRLQQKRNAKRSEKCARDGRQVIAKMDAKLVAIQPVIEKAGKKNVIAKSGLMPDLSSD